MSCEWKITVDFIDFMHLLSILEILQSCIKKNNLKHRLRAQACEVC